MENTAHKAGFVSIVGKPNVGKSTLMNSLVGENLSIISPKAQTTRHRIMGFINTDDYQIVYSDTPGMLKPSYELHKSMMRFVSFSLEDADVILFVVEVGEKADEEVLKRLKKVKDIPIFLLLNKIDQSTEKEVGEKILYWKDQLTLAEILPLSALKQINTDRVLPLLLNYLPVHPPYYPKDELTDRSERFFAAEMIREKIFRNYDKEIPYSCEVKIFSFKEAENIIRISAEIYVERDSQKGILIGHKGESLKKVGMQARKDMEAFFQKQIFLETHVKVVPDWRNKKQTLDRFGYNET